ncbi:MAG: aromatic ring-hydroxylating oxygenase subunit alpha [Nocardioidaceae bacterium]
MTAHSGARAGPLLPPRLLAPDGRSPDGLDHVLQPFGSSRMLPAAAYTSPEVLAWERRHLFAGTWTCLGRASDLRAAGDGEPLTQRAVVVGDIGVLLTWTDRLRAFANTCTHRGHELLGTDDTSSRRSIVCPYHAWSYHLAGHVQAAPGFRELPSFVPADNGLVELPVETWHGWVFCHAATAASPGAPVSFADHVGELGRLVAPYTPEDLVLGARHTYQVAANWKVISENYHECYHCPLIHPELCQVSPPTSGDNYDLPGAWVGGRMDLRDGARTMSLTGESNGRPIPGADPRTVEYLGLLPNLLISAHPDYLMAHRMVPLAPDLTWVECSWYFLAGDIPVDPAYAVEFWDITNRQDWSACESVQRGLASPHFRPGPFSPAEDAVHQFTTTIGRFYRGESLG